MDGRRCLGAFVLVGLCGLTACVPVVPAGGSGGGGAATGSGGGPALGAPGDAAAARPFGETTKDTSIFAGTILPPGNGYIAGPTQYNADDQRVMYDNLDDPVADHKLTDADLSKYYKTEPLGAPAGAKDRVEDLSGSGHRVKIRWDKWGVPHVQGATSEDVGYGAGYAIAEARFLVLELARDIGRAGILETSGGADNLVTALDKIGTLPHVSYSEAELQQQIDDAVAQAPSPAEGKQILAALDAYVAGVNAWMKQNINWPPLLAALGIAQPKPWTRTDVVASGITVNDIFGYGGGDEVGNARALQALQAKFGTEQGRKIYDDLRDPDDPNATTHVSTPFTYPVFSRPGGTPTGAGTVDPASIAMPDATASLNMVPGFKTATPPAASNHIVLAGSRTASGHPVLVGGPQSAYVFPELLFEMELQGGGYKASGITFPGIGPWIAIGHSTSYAWTVTSGDSDMVDERIEKLCDPNGPVTKESRYYVFNGACVPMTRPVGWDQMTVWRTVHGPVVGTTTVDGEPVAISRQRSSRGKEAQASLAFWRLSRGMVTDARDFASTMRSIPMSFNWSYANAHHIAYFHSGSYPIRARGASYDLPTWGTGQWEWQGTLDWHRQPQVVDPPQGYIVSWNNKPAPGWQSADNMWGVGAVQRVDLLKARVQGLTHASIADVVSAAQDAGTADLRAGHVLPELLKLLDGSPAPQPYLDELRTRLAAFAASGAHRRDRNHDDFYDDPMVAVSDNLWNLLVHSTFDPALGSFMTDDTVRRPSTIDNAPSLSGSAFNGPAWYSLEWRELRRAQGTEARPGGVPLLCGHGDLAQCRADLWKALDAAYWTTRNAQFLSNPNMSQWTKWAELDRIRFIPFIFNANSMRWVNKPTYHQVMSFR